MTDFALGTTFDIKFTTRRFTTGAPFALAGGVISAYVDNGLTQITAGITLTADFDGVTGLNNIRVVATSGNGFAAGTSVDLVITTGTVDSVSVVGEVVGSFTLERSAAFGRLGAPAGASVSADVAAVKVDTAAILVDTAEIGAAGAGLTAINLPNQTMDITGNITGNLSGSVGSVTGLTAATVHSDLDDIQARLPAALVGGRIDASVGAMAADVVTAAAIAANAIGASELAADAVAEIADQVWDEVLAGHLAAGSTGEALNTAGSGASAAVIADAVWDEARAGHVAAGSFGEGVVVNSVAAAERNAVADALLNRDMSAVSDTTARSPLNALRFLRNKWSVITGTLTVTKENDTTTAWTAATTGTAGADPITTVDPA